MLMIDRNDFRQLASAMLLRAKHLQTESNDYVVIPWSKVAEQLSMDPSNLSKIVTGVSDCKVSTFLAIIKSLGCYVSVNR